ncbi:MAG: hypothetical protein ASARMPREDX12_003684 [Alectoria sarmentosa]|nr:MAG: hypothetical protein ASARMPREDX12_003684 [Alectoria sarmentosa]
MNQDRDEDLMEPMHVLLPDSYSAGRNNLFDEIQRLSREVASIDTTSLRLANTRGSYSGLGGEEGCQQSKQTRDVNLYPISGPDNLLGPIANILFDEFGEATVSMPSQANAGEPQEMPDVSHELTQSYEHLNADLFSNKNLKANPSSGSSTGTMIYGDDARNAVLQAKQFDGLFGAAERSTPQTIDPDFIDRTSSWCQLPQGWNIPETFSANAPANVIPAFAYQSSPSHAQWSPRAVRAATPEPMYLKPPYPPSQLQQSISFNNGDIRTPSISPANFVSLDHAGSSRTTSVAPPTVMSTPSYISNLSTTTAPAPLIGDSLMCPFPGCHHAPFTGESKKTSLSRHMRDHREKFQCRVGDCTSVIRRSDNRRIHLERLHKSIQLPPKTSNPRKRKGPGGIDKILKCCFVRIQV